MRQSAKYVTITYLRFSDITRVDNGNSRPMYETIKRSNAVGGARVFAARGKRLCCCPPPRSQIGQETLLLQGDSATHLSVEILQLQNIPFEN